MAVVGLDFLCWPLFFFVFLAVAVSLLHHWNSWKNLRFLLGTIVSVNSESCFRTGKSGLRFFFSAGTAALIDAVVATVVAADAKAAAYEVGILGINSAAFSPPLQKKKETVKFRPKFHFDDLNLINR